MTKEEAIEEINKAFEPAFANYIITALTEGATVSDRALEQQPSEDCVSRAEVLNLVRLNAFHVKSQIKAIENMPPVTPTFPSSDDCVSREKVWYMITGGKYANEDYEQFIDRLVKELENMPPVTPTRKIGKWIKFKETEFGNGYQCSECGRYILTESIDGRKLEDFPYCHCGAKMRLNENV